VLYTLIFKSQPSAVSFKQKTKRLMTFHSKLMSWHLLHDNVDDMIRGMLVITGQFRMIKSP